LAPRRARESERAGLDSRLETLRSRLGRDPTAEDVLVDRPRLLRAARDEAQRKLSLPAAAAVPPGFRQPETIARLRAKLRAALTTGFDLARAHLCHLVGSVVVGDDQVTILPAPAGCWPHCGAGTPRSQVRRRFSPTS